METFHFWYFLTILFFGTKWNSLFQITECGKRGNQLTTVVVADQVEDVAIKDVSMLFGYQYLKLHFSSFFSTPGQSQ